MAFVGVADGLYCADEDKGYIAIVRFTRTIVPASSVGLQTASSSSIEGANTVPCLRYIGKPVARHVASHLRSSYAGVFAALSQSLHTRHGRTTIEI